MLYIPVFLPFKFPFELFGVHHQRCNSLAKLRKGSQAWIVEDVSLPFMCQWLGFFQTRKLPFVFLFPSPLYWINALFFFICFCFVFIIIVLSADIGVILVFFMLPVKHNSSFGLSSWFLSFFLSCFSFFLVFIYSYGSHRLGVGGGRGVLLRAKTAPCRAVKQRVESDFEYNKALENMQILILVKHMAIWNWRKPHGI